MGTITIGKDLVGLVIKYTSANREIEVIGKVLLFLASGERVMSREVTSKFGNWDDRQEAYIKEYGDSEDNVEEKATEMADKLICLSDSDTNNHRLLLKTGKETYYVIHEEWLMAGYNVEIL